MRLKRLDDGRYFFSTDSGKEITLSEFELLGLFRLSAPYRDRLAQQEEGPHPPVVQERPSKIAVGLDSHHTVVVIRYIYDDGDQKAYVMAPEDAASMRDGLTQKLEQIAVAKRGRTNN
ncbi:hypothetical protein [Bradyrhizobium sp. JYMT SZCCT0428]|uniref:hypothetical protein n=1 Tax=Bradyrhizobium sp. JYMT SZCCT0428 TaxID=2807673 RepID=UPI001BAA76D0|nr:hypothetical protein [Bradyrhizobium sp. JYMT SZCCT0428]MBR1151921.1 hypothetical protein [Bradyrhizobium sp. JYMT SZCCT0428]